MAERKKGGRENIMNCPRHENIKIEITRKINGYISTSTKKTKTKEKWRR